jgi:uncharacterized cupin superfamily protein
MLTGNHFLRTYILSLLTEEIIFRKNEPGYHWDFHHAPAKQFIILLDGEIEITTSNEEKRNFKGGDVLLVADTFGKGHATKNILLAIRSSIFIIIDD